MREKNQVVLPLDLEIKIPEGDFVFKGAEICERLDYTGCLSKKRSYKANPYVTDNMPYNEKKDEYTCANGKNLKFRRERTRTTENGYSITTRYYSNDKCGRCPHKDKCHKSEKGYRTIK